jgi:hypothetical protein
MNSFTSGTQAGCLNKLDKLLKTRSLGIVDMSPLSYAAWHYDFWSDSEAVYPEKSDFIKAIFAMAKDARTGGYLMCLDPEDRKELSDNGRDKGINANFINLAVGEALKIFSYCCPQSPIGILAQECGVTPTAPADVVYILPKTEVKPMSSFTGPVGQHKTRPYGLTPCGVQIAFRATTQRAMEKIRPMYDGGISAVGNDFSGASGQRFYSFLQELITSPDLQPDSRSPDGYYALIMYGDDTLIITHRGVWRMDVATADGTLNGPELTDAVRDLFKPVEGYDNFRDWYAQQVVSTNFVFGSRVYRKEHSMFSGIGGTTYFDIIVLSKRWYHYTDLFWQAAGKANATLASETTRDIKRFDRRMLDKKFPSSFQSYMRTSNVTLKAVEFVTASSIGKVPDLFLSHHYVDVGDYKHCFVPSESKILASFVNSSVYYEKGPHELVRAIAFSFQFPEYESVYLAARAVVMTNPASLTGYCYNATVYMDGVDAAAVKLAAEWAPSLEKYGYPSRDDLMAQKYTGVRPVVTDQSLAQMSVKVPQSVTLQKLQAIPLSWADEMDAEGEVPQLAPTVSVVQHTPSKAELSRPKLQPAHLPSDRAVEVSFREDEVVAVTAKKKKDKRKSAPETTKMMRAPDKTVATSKEVLMKEVVSEAPEVPMYAGKRPVIVGALPSNWADATGLDFLRYYRMAITKQSEASLPKRIRKKYSATLAAQLDKKPVVEPKLQWNEAMVNEFNGFLFTLDNFSSIAVLGSPANFRSEKFNAFVKEVLRANHSQQNRMSPEIYDIWRVAKSWAGAFSLPPEMVTAIRVQGTPSSTQDQKFRELVEYLGRDMIVTFVDSVGAVDPAE